ncbi:ankyrin [Piromyces finnis]|uniref:Ankyrin n=1 Tax=Piromyces finnis TaxID=1754191 RepID=A0A1Y1VMZ6_9FUNG|nr:ankyrin [Piromyces finnis]|eukprot:ORX60798.1 ankyrin [Piromyces finnis]
MNVNVCVQDDNGMTALMYVCENPLLTSIIKKLVLDSNCLNLLDKNGENSLFHALCNKDALYELIGTSININQKNNNNDTVLLHCCKNEIYEPIELLTLNNEIDVNITDSENKTAAMYLAEKAKFKELRSLNKRNCNYDFVNKRNESVLSIIIQKMYSSNEEKVCGEFVQYLHILTMLIHFNCSFNLPVDDDENTAIMVFMIVNDMTTLSYVLNYSNNYDLSIKNKFGENASSLAMKLNDNLAIIKKIVNHSTFDINYIDPHNKNTMLMLSVMNKSMFINQFIEDDVNSLNSVNSKDESALIVATKLENEDSVKKLLKYEIININQQDYLGNTALYYAVDLRNFEIIKSMIRGNADMNIKNKIGKSPLDLANEIGDKELLNVLLHPESYSHIEKENPLKSKQTLSNKYQETYEYLYPWIKNHFSEFTMTKSILSIEKSYFFKIKANIENTYDNKFKKGYYRFYGYH